MKTVWTRNIAKRSIYWKSKDEIDSLSEKLRLKVGIPRINQIDPFKMGRFRN